MYKPLSYPSRFGMHCTSCGSLVEACELANGSLEQCKEDASFHIEESIRNGDIDHPILGTAHEMLCDTILRARSRAL